MHQSSKALNPMGVQLQQYFILCPSIQAELIQQFGSVVVYGTSHSKQDPAEDCCLAGCLVKCLHQVFVVCLGLHLHTCLHLHLFLCLRTCLLLHQQLHLHLCMYLQLCLHL